MLAKNEAKVGFALDFAARMLSRPIAGPGSSSLSSPSATGGGEGLT